jgi:hypothetical protein
MRDEGLGDRPVARGSRRAGLLLGGGRHRRRDDRKAAEAARMPPGGGETLLCHHPPSVILSRALLRPCPACSLWRGAKDLLRVPRGARDAPSPARPRLDPPVAARARCRREDGEAASSGWRTVEDAIRRMRESAQADFVWFQRRIHSLLEDGRTRIRGHPKSRLRRMPRTRAATLGCPCETAACAMGGGAASGHGRDESRPYGGSSAGGPCHGHGKVLTAAAFPLRSSGSGGRRCCRR